MTRGKRSAMTPEGEIRDTLRVFAAQTAIARGEDIGVIDEFWLPSTNVRADLAVVGSEQLHGYEIKSSADTLRRLPGQVEAFGGVFDRCTLVVAEKHLRRAMDLVPRWWGLIVAREAGINSRDLQRIRCDGKNPGAEIDLVVRLLWREEVAQVLRDHGAEPDMRGGRSAMWRQLLACADSASISRAVCTALRSRSRWHDAGGQPRLRPAPAPPL